MAEPLAADLVGRADELRVLDELLDSVRGGRGRALVVVGEPGIGKSALVDRLGRRATDVDGRVLRVTGVESEMELAWAGLHQLIGPEIARIDRLPGPQRAALRVVLGLDDGGPPDPLMVARGALGLLLGLATAHPVLCLVDDVQWLDRESAMVLASVAHRTGTGALGVVLASRTETPELSGLPRLVVRGLAPPDAAALLDAALGAPLDGAVRRQLVREAAGNPLALLELPRGTGPAELAGGFALPGARPLAERIEESYRRRLAELPPTTRSMLLLAAADPVGDPALLRAAGACLGLGPRAVRAAVDEQLLEIDAGVRFTHPLARSAIYRAADADQRRQVHLALEEVTDPDTDPDRRAWHRAQAVAGPDEDTARALEQASERARARGGVAAAAAFLERAAGLSPARRARADRLLAAADLARLAGAGDRARILLDGAADGVLDEDQAARAALIRGRVALDRGPATEAVQLLVDAAARLRTCGLPGVHDAVRDALVAATAGTVGPELEHLVRTATAVVAADRPDPVGSPTDLLVEGLRVRALEGAAAAVPVLRRALDGIRARVGRDGAVADAVDLAIVALPLSTELWDDRTGVEVVDRLADTARRQGALGAVGSLHRHHVLHRLATDGVHAARRVLDEGRGLVGRGTADDEVRLLLAAWAGEDDTGDRPAGPDTTLADCADAVRANARGDADGALRAVAPLVRLDRFSLGPLVVTEFADAAARAGRTADLAAAEAWIVGRADLTATPWSLGVAARVRALGRAGEEAREHYEDSLEQLSRSTVGTELARTHLAYGEWLRRRRSRTEAREHLHRAVVLFGGMGVHGFADRAGRELRAVGDPVRAGGRDGSGLTPQEVEVATLAADGLTNPQIAARLALSPRTVQHHLRGAYAELGVSSRTRLGQALRDRGIASAGSAAP